MKIKTNAGNLNVASPNNPCNSIIKRLNSVVLIILMTTSFSYAQTSQFQIAHGGTGLDIGSSIINTSDGGFAIIGFTNSFGAGNLDAYFIKTNNAGTVEFSKTLGGTNLDDAGSISQTSDGGYIIAGRTRSYGSDVLNNGLVVKLDNLGNVQFSKVFDMPGNTFFSVIRELDGGGYIVGGNSDVGPGGKNILLARLDALGNEVWVKTFGNALDEFVHYLEPTLDGGFILVGDRRQYTPGSIEVFLIKTNSLGSIQWSKSYTGVSIDLGQSAEELQLVCTSDKGFVIAGSTSSFGSGGIDGLIFKTDSLGNLVWVNTYGGAADDQFFTIKEDPNTGLLLAAGTTESFGSGQVDVYLVTIDNAGNLIDSKTYGSSGDEALASTDDVFQITPDGGIVMTGFTTSFGAGAEDVYIVKTDPTGSSGCNEVTSVSTLVTSPILPVNNIIPVVTNTGFTPITHSLTVASPAAVFDTAACSLCPGPDASFTVAQADSCFRNTVFFTSVDLLGTHFWEFGDNSISTDVNPSHLYTSDGTFTVTHIITSPCGSDTVTQDIIRLFCPLCDALTIEFDKTFGGSSFDAITSLQQTSDGGFILGGASSSGISGDKTEPRRGDTLDYWIVKTDANGNKIFDKTFGGDSLDALLSIQQTTDGGFILGGLSGSPISGDKTEARKGDQDFWIVKTDANGNKIFDKTLGGIFIDDDEILFSLQQTTDGGFILGGRSKAGISGDKTEANRGEDDMWIVKIDASGNKVFDKTFGGNEEDLLFSLQQTTDGGFILAGASKSPISGDKTEANQGDFDMWIVKTDASGNKIFDKTFGGSGLDAASSVVQTADGGFILAGLSSSGISGDKTEANRGGLDIWLVKTDANGNKIFDKTFGGSAAEGDTALFSLASVVQTADGGFMIGVVSSSGVSGDKTEASKGGTDYWIVKTDANGNKIFDKTIGGSTNDLFFDLQQTSDGGFVLGGGSLSGVSGDKTEANQGSFDYWMVKLLCCPASPADASFTIAGNNCFGDILSFTSTDTAGTHLWDFGDGSPTSTDVNPTRVFLSVGPFTITHIVTNICGSDTFTSSVTIIPPADAGFGTVPSVACVGDVVGPFRTKFTVGKLTEFWDFGDGGRGSTSTGSAPTYIYAGPGLFTITHIVTNICGSDTVAQVIQIGPPQDASFILSPDSVCKGDTVFFTSTDTSSTTNHTWNFGDGSPTSTDANPIHVYNPLIVTHATFQVIHTVSNLCGSNSDTLTVTVFPPGSANFSVLTNPCTNINVLNVGFFAIGATGTHFWDDGNGNTFTGIQPVITYPTGGTFTITHIFTNLCGSDTATKIVTVIPLPDASFTSSAPSCFLDTVSFTSTFTSGAHFWDFGDVSTSVVVNPTHVYLSGGTFTVIHVVSNTCNTPPIFRGTPVIVIQADTVTDTLVIPAAITASIVGTDVSCNGGSDGSADLTVSGGTAPFTFSWSNGATTEDISGLSAGEFNVTITDFLGCSLIIGSSDTCITMQPDASLGKDAFVFSLPVQKNTNFGTSPFFRATTWTFGGIPGTIRSFIEFDLTSIPSTTTIIEATLFLTSDSTSAFPFGHSTFSGSNNTVLNRVTAAWNESTVTWNNQPSTTTLNQIAIPATTSIDEDFAINVTGFVQDMIANPGTNHGMMWRLVTEAAFREVVFGSSDNTDAFRRPRLVICLVDSSAVVINEPDPIVITDSIVNVTCNGGSDGSIDLTVSGGTPPFTFAWSNGATTEDISGLSVGIFGVTVTDANGCTGTDGITITQPIAITTSIVGTNVSCNGGSDGSADLTVSGGTLPFTFAWSNGTTMEDISGLSAGILNVTVTDANGCTGTGSVTITQPAEILTSTVGTNVSCNDGSDGSVDLTVSGGTAPFTFAWSNGATTEDISGLSIGVFEVDITDNNGCTAADIITITEPPVITTSLSATNVTCNGGSDGSVDLTVSGGTPPFTFAWSNGATTEDISGLNAGSFGVTVTDNNGCTASNKVTITEPSAISTSIAGTNISCNGGSDGSADLTVSGGTPPFTFAWSNGATTEDISGLNAGLFTVTVTDANGCTGTGGVTITQPVAITTSISGTNVTCIGGSDGSADLTVSNGVLPLTFAWSNGATTEDLTGLSAGTFNVTVTDANGCTATDGVTILDGTISVPDGSFGIAGDSCFRDTVSFTSVFTSGTHFWDFGDGSPTSTDVNPTHVFVSEGIFSVVHVASNICGSDTVTVDVTRQFCCVASPGCPNPTFTSILASDNNIYIAMNICDRDLNVCADEQIFDFTIKHRNLTSSNVDNLTFELDLPTGTSFGSFTVLESPGGTIMFDVPSLTFTLPALPADSMFRIQVTAIINCSIVPFAQAGNPILVGAEANYEVGAVPFILAGTDPESYNIENGDLVIIDITNQFFVGNVGDSYVRKITVLNGGNGSLSAFDLTEAFDPGISVNGALTSLVRTFVDIDFTNNPDSSSNGDCFFDRDEILIISDTVVILNCDSAKTQIDATFGCDGDTCLPNGDVAFANTLISNGSPNFTVPVVQYIPTNYCSPDTGTVTYRYRNNGFETDPGGADANDIKVTFRATNAVSTLINFQLNGIPLTSIPGLSVSTAVGNPYTRYIIRFANLTNDPDGPGGIDDLDNDGFFDNLAKDSSFTITADFVMSCPNEFAVECPARFYHEIVRTWINYKDQCKKNRPGRNGANFRVEGFRQFKPETSGPPELGDQETGTYCFNFDYRIRGLQNMSCNNFKPVGIVVLPAGFSAIPGSATVQGNPTAAITSTTFTQSNDTIFIVGLPLQTINADRKRCFQKFCIDLTLDCNDPDLAFISEIKFEKRFECDSTCSCAIRMGCTSIEVKNLCTCEDTLITTLDFEAVRTTLGWTNPSRSTLISPTRPGIRLDRVYECDSIRTCAPGVVLTNTITNAQVTITNGVFGNDTILIPSNAFFVITDVSAGTTITCPAGPPVITNSMSNPDTFRYVYDATPCIAANFGGALNLGDSIKLVADFGIKKSSTIPNQIITEFSCFTATHSTVRNAETITCDSRGTRMYVLKSTIATVLRRSAFAPACGRINRTLRFRAVGGTCGANDFPNEFRNLYRVGDTVEFFLPTGYSYVPGTGRFFTQDGGTITIADPIISNGVVTFRRGDNTGLVNGWPLQDKRSNTESRLSFGITPSCEAEEAPTRDTVRFDYVNYHFAADPVCFDSIFDVIRTSNVHHLTPHIDIEPKLPSIVGINPVDTFCIRLCNDLRVPLDTASDEPPIDTVDFPLYNAPNTWLVFDNPTGNLDILFAIDTTNGASDTLEIIGLSGDSILINTDGIGLFDCRFITLLTSSQSCSPTDIDSVIVTGGWSCSFLDSISDIACLQDTDRLFFFPKESAKQVSLIRPVNNVFDACAPVTYELEIVNSRLPRVFDITVQAQLPAGMTYLPNSSNFKYPLASAFTSIPESLVTVSGDTITYIIDSLNAEIDSIGLEGVTNIARNKFRIKFDVTTDCDYTSGSVVEFTVSCFTNCDSLIVFRFTTDPQFLTGTLPEYTTNINADSDGFANCSDSTEVSFNILVNGPDATSPTDSVEILLPEGTSFITGSFVGITNPPTHSAPDQSIVGTQTLLKWDLPDGIGLGGSIQFSIGLGKDSTLACGTLDLEVSTTFKDSSNCVSQIDSVCFVTGISGNRTFEIDVVKPDLDLSGFTASIGVGCNFTVVSIDVSNSGIDVPAGTTTQVDFFCDNDGSGGLSPGDSLVGSLSTTSSILTGGFVTLADTVEICDSAIIAVIDGDVNCVCAGAEVITDPVSDTVNVCCVDHLQDITSVDVDCFRDSTGQATAVLAGGTSPFTFAWSNGGNTQTITNLTAGTFSVTVTDARDCEESDTTEITEPPALVLSLSSSTFNCGFNVSCNGGSDGSATASSSGGTPGFTFLWSDGQTTSTATGLSAGNFTVTVTDNNGCTIVDNITLTEPDVLVTDLGSDQSFNFGCSCADLSASTTGGCAPFTYLWSTGEVTMDITVCPELSAEFSVTVTDANGCTALDSVTITKPPVVNQVEQYVLFGINYVEIQSNDFFCDSGSVGVQNGGSYVTIQSNNEIQSWVAGDDVSIQDNNDVCEIHFGNSFSEQQDNHFGQLGNPPFNNNSLGDVGPFNSSISSQGSLSGSCIGVQNDFTAPLVTLPDFVCGSGGAEIVISSGSTGSRNVVDFDATFGGPGDYGNLLIGSDVDLTFNGPGIYTFSYIDVGSNTGFIAANANTFIFVCNGDAKFSSNDSICAMLFVGPVGSGGTFEIGSNNRVTGSFIADQVKVGSNNSFCSKGLCWDTSGVNPSAKMAGGVAQFQEPGTVEELSIENNKVEITRMLVEVYPNPTTGLLTVEIISGVHARVMIYNPAGEVVGLMDGKDAFNHKFEFDLSELVGGVYLIQIIADEEVVTKRVIYIE